LTTVSGPSLSAALLTPVTRARVVAQLDMVLGVGYRKAKQVVEAFDEFVAKPLDKHLRKLNGRDLVKRNPMIYTARGTDTVNEWVAAVLADKETSVFEGLLGNWQEEVAMIVSGGFKPAGGVDLQVNGSDGVVRLYTIQTAPNTKNASGRKNDIAALRTGAAILAAQKKLTELNTAVLHGRKRSLPHRNEPGISNLGSDDFWHRMSGISDFRARLLQATAILSDLIAERSADEIERIRGEAEVLFDDGSGALKMDALANPPRKTKVERPEQLSLLTDG
jgi:hypothetical protein